MHNSIQYKLHSAKKATKAKDQKDFKYEICCKTDHRPMEDNWYLDLESPTIKDEQNKMYV